MSSIMSQFTFGRYIYIASFKTFTLLDKVTSLEIPVLSFMICKFGIISGSLIVDSRSVIVMNFLSLKFYNFLELLIKIEE
jgi:hypothetical protein